jgi:hypothetical protein
MSWWNSGQHESSGQPKPRQSVYDSDDWLGRMKRRRKPEAPPQRAATSTGPPPEVIYYDDIPEHAWTHLGELNSPDPFAEPPDYSKARRWKPLREFLAERDRLPWWLRG